MRLVASNGSIRDRTENRLVAAEFEKRWNPL